MTISRSRGGRSPVARKTPPSFVNCFRSLGWWPITPRMLGRVPSPTTRVATRSATSAPGSARAGGRGAVRRAGVRVAASGVDAAPTAGARAEETAKERGPEARFLVADALDLGSLGEQFDTVVDSGLFHVFEDDDRARYVESLGRVVRSGGRYFMLCFSEHQPGD